MLVRASPVRHLSRSSRGYRVDSPTGRSEILVLRQHRPTLGIVARPAWFLLLPASGLIVLSWLVVFAVAAAGTALLEPAAGAGLAALAAKAAAMATLLTLLGFALHALPARAARLYVRPAPRQPRA